MSFLAKREIPMMELLETPSMATVAGSPAIGPWINIESTQGFLTLPGVRNDMLYDGSSPIVIASEARTPFDVT